MWGIDQTYAEVLQVVNAHSETEKVEQSILKHASVAVAGVEVSITSIARLAEIAVMLGGCGGSKFGGMLPSENELLGDF